MQCYSVLILVSKTQGEICWGNRQRNDRRRRLVLLLLLDILVSDRTLGTAPYYLVLMEVVVGSQLESKASIVSLAER